MSEDLQQRLRKMSIMMRLTWIIRTHKQDMALLKSLQQCDKAKAKLLVELGANPNFGLHPDWGALNIATTNKSQELVELVLQHGAKVSLPLGPPFLEAIRTGEVGIVEMLLNHGVVAERRHHVDMLPLVDAMSEESLESRRDICKPLIAHGGIASDKAILELLNEFLARTEYLLSFWRSCGDETLVR